ncbi:MAG: PstS family phosphate ABC transporter substrate-binding protein [candidate division WOR-3 bacterium]
MKRFILLLFLVLGCSPGGRGSKIVNADGSSTVYPVTEAVADKFQKDNPDIKVTVGISGTGGGFKKFCRGETDISNASRPIKESEIENCKKNGIEFIELPIGYDALTVVVNPQNDWVDYFTVEELKRIWEPEAQGKITKWNQIRNNWPDAPLNLFGPGVDSGTFDYFTEAIVGKEDASRGDYTSSEDDNVLVVGVANDKYALGYFGFAYYIQNKDKVKAVPIDNGSGPVEPTYENVINGTYQPLSRPLFIYVNKKSYTEKPHVKKFVDYYITNVKDLIDDVGYIPLPDEVYELAKKRLENGITGSVFKGKGSTPGVKITDLLKMEQ